MKAQSDLATRLPANGEKLELWNNADITHIANQMPYPILPVMVQPDMDANDTVPPIPYQPDVDLTEGPHMGYALQWFTFATTFAGCRYFSIAILAVLLLMICDPGGSNLSSLGFS